MHAERSESEKRAALNVASKPVRAGDPVDLWMRRRGLGAPSYPACLRFCPQVRHSGPPIGFHPAMVAKVTDATGRPVMIHRTYLTTAGTKAPVDKVRMFCAGKVPPGSAVRLAPAAAVIGVAEGIETALAATKLFTVPTWAALFDGGVEKFEPPARTERLVIFGDNDANGAGQRVPTRSPLAWRRACRLTSSSPRSPAPTGTTCCRIVAPTDEHRHGSPPRRDRAALGAQEGRARSVQSAGETRQGAAPPVHRPLRPCPAG
jgi:Toprim domain